MTTWSLAPILLGLASPQGTPGQGSLFAALFPILLMFAIFYFVLILPARRKQKKHAEMLRKLKSGDRVITTSGIYGTVVGVSDDVVQLRIADGVKIEIAKHAVGGLQLPREK